MCRRVVDAAETAERSFLLIAERLTGNFTIQRGRNAPAQRALCRLIVLRHNARILQQL